MLATAEVLGALAPAHVGAGETGRFDRFWAHHLGQWPVDHTQRKVIAWFTKPRLPFVGELGQRGSYGTA